MIGRRSATCPHSASAGYSSLYGACFKAAFQNGLCVRALQAWTGQQLTCGENVLGTNFVEIPVDLRFQAPLRFKTLSSPPG